MRSGKRSSLYQILFVLLLLIVSFTYAYSYYHKNTERHIEEERDRFLHGEIVQQSAYIDSVLEGQFRTLESMAELIGGEPERGRELFQRLADSSIKYEEFWRMIIADKEGNYRTSDGNRGNITHRDYFQKTLNQDRVISEPFLSGVEDGYICLMLAVPVRDQEGEVFGILGGSYKVARFGELLMDNANSKNQYAILLDREGNVVAAFYEGLFGVNMGNIFQDEKVIFLDGDSSEQIRQAMDAKITCTYRMKRGQKEMYATQIPFGYNDWTMVMFTDQEAVDASYAYIRQNTRIINLIMGTSAAICFAILFLIMIRDKRRMRKDAVRNEGEQMRLAMSEERYRLAASDSAVMVFEVNLQEKEIESNDNFQKFFGSKGSYQGFIAGSFVFAEDMEIYTQALSKVLDDKDNTDRQLRMVKGDGSISWCQMMLRVLKDERGEPARLIGMFRDIDKEKREMQLLELRALTDTMTGLSNKMATQELVSRVLEEYPRGIHGMLLIDLDNLKRINDYLGHAEGDKAIVAIADTIKTSFRSTDIGGRVGGDEFVVFLINVKSEERLRSLVAAFVRRISMCRIGENMDQPLACSIGAVITDGTEATFIELYKRADTSLYYVKRNGKNGFALYRPGMDTGEYLYEEELGFSVSHFNRGGEIEFHRLLNAVSCLYSVIISVNVTRNQYAILEYKHFKTTSCTENGVYSELLVKKAAAIHPDDRECYLQTFSVDALLKAASQGVNRVYLETRQMADDGSYHWIASESVSVEDVEGSDLIQIMVEKGIERE